MMTQLDVVNDCLAIMGEAPLNAIEEDHTFKEGALNILNRVKKTILAQGWWFNMECIELSVNPDDGRIYLPSDIATLYPFKDIPWVVQRGRTLYDLKRGSNIFPLGQKVNAQLNRNLTMEQLPDTFAAYIGRQTVLEFQLQYDGDQTKTRNLQTEIYGSYQLGVIGLRAEAIKEHVRNRNVNLIDSSPRVQRVKFAYERTMRTRLTPGGRTT